VSYQLMTQCEGGMTSTIANSDPVIEYLRLYREMRYAYGVNSSYVGELTGANHWA
jgi:hypothetical protein